MYMTKNHRFNREIRGVLHFWGVLNGRIVFYFIMFCGRGTCFLDVISSLSVLKNKGSKLEKYCWGQIVALNFVFGDYFVYLSYLCREAWNTVKTCVNKNIEKKSLSYTSFFALFLQWRPTVFTRNPLFQCSTFGTGVK